MVRMRSWYLIGYLGLATQTKSFSFKAGDEGSTSMDLPVDRSIAYNCLGTLKVPGGESQYVKKRPEESGRQLTARIHSLLRLAGRSTSPMDVPSALRIWIFFPIATRYCLLGESEKVVALIPVGVSFPS